jgi:hypothetical protein
MSLCLTYISSHLILVSAHNGDEPPKVIILLVVLYDSNIWLLTCENLVLSKTFGCMREREKMSRDGIKLRYEKPFDLYSSSNIIR